MIKKIAIITFFVGLLLALCLDLLLGNEFALSLLIGCFLMILNLLGLAFLWKLIFSKKSIALAVLVIIFKYLILGLILWNLSESTWLNPVGFVAGLGCLLIGIVGSLAFQDKKNFQNK